MPLQKSPCKRFEMYIPKYPMDPYRRLKNALAGAFDGYTELPMSLGYWAGPFSEEVACEGVSVFILVLHPEREQDLIKILTAYKEDADQQAVMLTSTPTDVVML